MAVSIRWVSGARSEELIVEELTPGFLDGVTKRLETRLVGAEKVGGVNQCIRRLEIMQVKRGDEFVKTKVLIGFVLGMDRCVLIPLPHVSRPYLEATIAGALKDQQAGISNARSNHGGKDSGFRLCKFDLPSAPRFVTAFLGPAVPSERCLMLLDTIYERINRSGWRVVKKQSQHLLSRFARDNFRAQRQDARLPVCRRHQAGRGWIETRSAPTSPVPGKVVESPIPGSRLAALPGTLP